MRSGRTHHHRAVIMPGRGNFADVFQWNPDISISHFCLLQFCCYGLKLNLWLLQLVLIDLSIDCSRPLGLGKVVLSPCEPLHLYVGWRSILSTSSGTVSVEIPRCPCLGTSMRVCFIPRKYCSLTDRKKQCDRLWGKRPGSSLLWVKNKHSELFWYFFKGFSKLGRGPFPVVFLIFWKLSLSIRFGIWWLLDSCDLFLLHCLETNTTISWFRISCSRPSFVMSHRNTL